MISIVNAIACEGAAWLIALTVLVGDSRHSCMRGDSYEQSIDGTGPVVESL